MFERRKLLGYGEIGLMRFKEKYIVLGLKILVGCGFSFDFGLFLFDICLFFTDQQVMNFIERH